MGFPMPQGLKRYSGWSHLPFLTFRCYRRLPLLRAARARNLFVRELARVRTEYAFALVGYVVMPEHMHLLIAEPRKGNPSTVLKMWKQRVSRKMRKKRRGPKNSPWQLSFAEFGGGELRQFWQARFYDFNVYSEKKKREKLHYMHANPVLRKLVKHPRDWPWSSWSGYMKDREGSIAVDPR